MRNCIRRSWRNLRNYKRSWLNRKKKTKMLLFRQRKTLKTKVWEFLNYFWYNSRSLYCRYCVLMFTECFISVCRTGLIANFIQISVSHMIIGNYFYNCIVLATISVHLIIIMCSLQNTFWLFTFIFCLTMDLSNLIKYNKN